MATRSVATSTRPMQVLQMEPHYRRALAYLARETGDPNMSGFVRRQIESQMRERFGPNWITRLDEIESRDVAVPA